MDCEWGDFTWGPCSQTCGSGTKEGSRTVTTYQAYGGSGCTGPEKRTVKCNIGDCPPVSCTRRCFGADPFQAILHNIIKQP